MVFATWAQARSVPSVRALLVAGARRPHASSERWLAGDDCAPPAADGAFANQSFGPRTLRWLSPAIRRSFP
jgi:hypothetical protein